MRTTLVSPDGLPRCDWCRTTPELLRYHDTEWGFPVGDDYRLFEKLSLEGFQAGLSWRTILAKRENFRAAFHDFDFHEVARFTPHDVDRLLTNEGIVRHRGKIEAVVNNARRARDLVEQDGSLAAYLWRFEADAPCRSSPGAGSVSEKAWDLAQDLKRRGWKFIGSTTTYAFMQSMGLINDHGADCVIRSQAELVRASFKRPGRK